MSIAYILVNCDMGYEIQIISRLKELCDEVQGTYGIYDFICKLNYDDTESFDVWYSPNLFMIACLLNWYAFFAEINASSTVLPAIQCFAILNKTFSINCMPETTISFLS